MKNKTLTLTALGGILITLLFIIITAMGFGGILPGSRLYKNKEDRGYYVFFRFLEEREFAVEFEKKYQYPQEGNNTIIYIDGEEGFYTPELKAWVSRGNTLLLLGQAVKKSELKAEESSPITGIVGEEIFLEQKWGQGRILLITQPDYLVNESLQDLNRAEILDQFIRENTQGILFLREQRAQAQFSPTPLGELFSGKLILPWIQLMVLLVFFLFKKGVRTVRPQRREGRKLRKISEHIKGVGLFYQRAAAHEIVERVNGEYFEKIICRNRIPEHMDKADYDRLRMWRKENSREDSMNRFFEREGHREVMNRNRENRNG